MRWCYIGLRYHWPFSSAILSQLWINLYRVEVHHSDMTVVASVLSLIPHEGWVLRLIWIGMSYHHLAAPYFEVFAFPYSFRHYHTISHYTSWHLRSSHHHLESLTKVIRVTGKTSQLSFVLNVIPAFATIAGTKNVHIGRGKMKQLA